MSYFWISRQNMYVRQETTGGMNADKAGQSVSLKARIGGKRGRSGVSGEKDKVAANRKLFHIPRQSL